MNRPVLIVIGLLAVLALLSLIPADRWPVNAVPRRIQKAMHVLLYGLLAGLILTSVVASGIPPARAAPVAWALATGAGALLELLQRYRPGRRGSWGDVGRDALGAALGAGVGMSLL